MAKRIYPGTKLLLYLLLLFLFSTLTGCAHWISISAIPPGAEGFTPANVETRMSVVLTNIKVTINGEDSGINESFLNLFLDKLRETKLFYPVAYSPGAEKVFSENNRGVELTLFVDERSKSSTSAVALCVLLPVSYEFESEMRLVVRRWDGSEREYTARSKTKQNDQILSASAFQWTDVTRKTVNGSINSLMYQLLQDTKWCVGK